MPGEALDDLQHDHAHLSRLVFDVRDCLAGWEKAPSDPVTRAALGDAVEALLDDLAIHFTREEEGLFPFVLTRAAHLGERILRLSTLHDALCGALVRLSRGLASDGADAATALSISTAFQRFQDAYAEHAREERALLELLPQVLAREDLPALRAILSAL